MLCDLATYRVHAYSQRPLPEHAVNEVCRPHRGRRPAIPRSSHPDGASSGSSPKGRVRPRPIGGELPQVGQAPETDDDPGPLAAAGVHDDRQRGRRLPDLCGGRDGRQGQEPDPDARGMVPMPTAGAATDAAGVPVSCSPLPCLT